MRLIEGEELEVVHIAGHCCNPRLARTQVQSSQRWVFCRDDNNNPPWDNKVSWGRGHWPT